MFNQFVIYSQINGLLYFTFKVPSGRLELRFFYFNWWIWGKVVGGGGYFIIPERVGVNMVGVLKRKYKNQIKTFPEKQCDVRSWELSRRKVQHPYVNEQFLWIKCYVFNIWWINVVFYNFLWRNFKLSLKNSFHITWFNHNLI